MQPITFSTEWMTPCSLGLFLAAAKQTVMDDVGMDSMTTVEKFTVISIGSLQLLQEVQPLLSLLGEGADVLLPLQLLGDAQEVEELNRGHQSVIEQRSPTTGPRTGTGPRIILYRATKNE